MAENGHGGYRKPRNPAPVSGPGAHSRRTDGGPEQPKRYLQGENYGDSKELNDLQGAAPLASASPLPEGFAGFSAGTMRPDEPETAGLSFGEGDGYSGPLNIWIDDDEPGTPDMRFDPVADAIRNAYAANPTPELAAALYRLEAQGR